MLQTKLVQRSCPFLFASIFSISVGFGFNSGTKHVLLGHYKIDAFSIYNLLTAFSQSNLITFNTSIPLFADTIILFLYVSIFN